MGANVTPVVDDPAELESVMPDGAIFASSGIGVSCGIGVSFGTGVGGADSQTLEHIRQALSVS